MPKFSWRSKENLYSCDTKLVSVFEAVIEVVDCTVLCGLRTMEEQATAFATGHSKKEWPDSRHNTRDAGKSEAIDVIPWPIDWNDRERITLFAGYVMGVSRSMGVMLRWGGDWDEDWQTKDNTFDDLVHFELRKAKK